ncbi:MAG: trifunctional transcriptional activator/DNA repair protein Ada/methylated-DNA--[protein]-cysteine S-methyltransferase [Paracoccaceae bacterium]
MLFQLPEKDVLYAALCARDDSYEGRAWVGVTTTGIFCRLSCPARNPKPENCKFMTSVADCLEAGFRPCKRCKPLASGMDADPMVAALVKALDADPGRRWGEGDITGMGYDLSTVRRAFKRHYGVTFLDMARLARIRHGAKAIERGERVINAQLDAGFDSGSGFRAAFARVLGMAPSSFTGNELLRADWFDTPLGPMIAVADKRHLMMLEFFERKSLASELKKLQKAARGSIGIGRLPPIDQIEAEMQGFFTGQLRKFKTPLAPVGTPFSKSVWDQLCEIPVGETRSYADVARAIDRPSATRAVARANGANPIAIVVPCHRVIGSDGSLTGYGGGLWRKRWLIEHEAGMAR